MGLRSLLDFDWRRLMRWSLLGAVVMGLWLIAPTAKCAVAAFRSEPLDAAHPVSDTPGTHTQESVEGDGFFERWGSAIKVCYRHNPPMEQEGWKKNLLFGFGAGIVVFYVLSEIERRNKRTYS
jgi:hypothetical protein